MTTRKRLFDAGGRRRPLVFLTFSFCLISLALGQTCPTSGAVSITSDCTYTAGTYSLSSLSVSNSATVTFVGSDFTATTGTTLNVAGSVTINSGSTLSAPDSGTFYLYTEGINSLIDPFLTYEGGSHGGKGSASTFYPFSLGRLNFNPTYGNVFAPDQVGSSYGIAGGAIKIVAGGDITVNGVIDVSAPDLSSDGPGGSGGSIWLQATGSVLGSGTIRANGASNSDTDAVYGVGGGGRISIEGDASSSFSGTAEALGGVGPNPEQRGGAGTIYMAAPPSNTFIKCDNAGNRSPYDLVEPVYCGINLPTGLGASYTLPALILGASTGASISAEAGTTVSLSSVSATDSHAFVAAHGDTDLDLSGLSGVLTNFGVGVLSPSASLTISSLSSRTVAAESGLILQAGTMTGLSSTALTLNTVMSLGGDIEDGGSLGTLSLGSLTMGSSATIYTEGGSTGIGPQLDVTGAVVIPSGAMIDGRTGGHDPLNLRSSPFPYHSGAHGGHGVASYFGFDSMSQVNEPYGDAKLPRTLGQQSTLTTTNNGVGGGAISIMASTITLEGTIDVSANPGEVWGAAGGSVHLQSSSTMTGSGTISANGASAGQETTSSGAGGRVALAYGAGSVSGFTITAHAGDAHVESPELYAGPGSIYSVHTGTGIEAVRCDNNGRSRVSDGTMAVGGGFVGCDLASASSSTWVLGSLHLSGGAIAVAPEGSTFSFASSPTFSGDSSGFFLGHGTVDVSSISSFSGDPIAVGSGANGTLVLPSSVTLSSSTIGLNIFGAVEDNGGGAPSITVNSGGVVNLGAGVTTSSPLQSLTVASGGQVNVFADGDSCGSVLYVNGAFSLASGASINGTSTGLYLGPGRPLSQGAYGLYTPGAGHGGSGGLFGGAAYGSALQPTHCGSGGWRDFDQFHSGYGGAAFHVNAGSVVLDGVVEMSGGDGFGVGGGSGGSVWLQSRGTLSGSGIIVCDGGDAINNYDAGSGSGGRVALWYTSSTFSGTISAAAGPATNPDNDDYPPNVHVGAHGTIVYHDTDDDTVTLRVDGGGLDTVNAAQVLDVSEDSRLSSADVIELYNTASLLPGLASVTVSALVGDGTGTLVTNSTLDVSAVSAGAVGLEALVDSSLITSTSLTLSSGASWKLFGSVSGMTGDVTISSGARLELGATSSNDGLSPGEYNMLDLTVASGGSLFINSLNTLSNVELNVDDFTVDGTVSGSGFTQNYKGSGGGPGVYYGSARGSPGASHGGFGGSGGDYDGIFVFPSLPGYGSPLAPSSPGSAGVCYSFNCEGSDEHTGGGAIAVLASGNILINGNILMDASNVTSGTGGAGGSIYLNAAGTLSGSGTLSAQGGTTEDYFLSGDQGGNGAGGRISLVASSLSSWTGTVRLHSFEFNQPGGTHYRAGPGTLYLEDSSTSRLIVDNAGIWSLQPADLCGDLTSLSVDVLELYHDAWVAPTCTLSYSSKVGTAEASLAVAGTLDASSESTISVGLHLLPGSSVSLPSALTVDGTRFMVSGTPASGLSSLTVSASSTAVFNSTGSTASSGTPGVFLLSDVTVASGGELQVQSVDLLNMTASNVTIDVSGTFSVASGGLVSGVGGGYPSETGPGAGVEDFLGGSGAGHAGQGGLDDNLDEESSGSSYGSYDVPNVGSGGGSGSSDEPGGRGGASFMLTGGTLALDGVIDVSGGTTQNRGGAGSGGSIVIDMTTVTGSGEIKANGGDTTTGDGGGGGGGRIIVQTGVSGMSGFSGAFEAKGGINRDNVVLEHAAAAGTVYFQSTQTIWIDNGGIATLDMIRTPLPSVSSFSVVLVNNEALVEVSTPWVVGASQLVGNGTVFYEADVDLSAQTVITVSFRASGSGGALSFAPAVTLSGALVELVGQVNGLGNVDVTNGGTLHVNGTAYTPGLGAGDLSLNDLFVEDGSAVTVSGVIGLYTENIFVQAGGKISGDGGGFRSAQGPGAGAYDSRGGSGGGHGGPGGESFDGIAGGTTYGTVTEPRTMGSGGGPVELDGTGEGMAGGAALLLNATLTITVDGVVSCNGLDGVDIFADEAGSGAGGSVWVNAGRFDGTGEVTANGGSISDGSGGGGGYVYSLSCNTVSGPSLSANGGTGDNGARSGGSGVVGSQTVAGCPTCVEEGTCTGNDGCDPVCQNNGTCTGGFCVCPPEWTGQSCASPVCTDNCNYPQGVCVAGSCSCLNGYRGSSCQIVATPVSVATPPNALLEEGDDYTETVSVTAGTAPFTFLLEEGPDGLTLNASSGVVSWENVTAGADANAVTVKVWNEYGFETVTWTVNVVGEFYVEVSDGGFTVGPANSGPIALTGRTLNVAGLPVPDVEAIVWISVQGTRRPYKVTSDGSGDFSFNWFGLYNEAGTYTIGGEHPLVPNNTVQDGFDLYGIAGNPGSTSGLTVTAGGSGAMFTDKLAIANLGDQALGVSFQGFGGDTDDLTIQVINPPTALGPRSVVYLTISVTASPSAVIDARGLYYDWCETAQGTCTRLNMQLLVVAATPDLTTSESIWKAAVVREGFTTVTFPVENVGGVDADNVQVFLPAGLPWAHVVTPRFTSIPVGGSVDVTFTLTPDDQLEFGAYSGSLGLVPSNGGPLSVPFQFTIASDASASIKIIVEDEFTYWSVPDYPRPANVTVELRNSYAIIDDAGPGRGLSTTTAPLLATGVTNDDGEVEIEGLVEGAFEIVLSSEDHVSQRGLVYLRPGSDNEAVVFIPRDLVTVRWSVREVVLVEEYTFRVQSVFQTNVPAPVITIEPEEVDIFALTQTTTVNFEICNHGLIRADDLSLGWPTNVPGFSVNQLVDPIGDLDAMTCIFVPTVFEVPPGGLNSEDEFGGGYWAPSVGSGGSRGGRSGRCPGARLNWNLECGGTRYFSTSVELGRGGGCGNPGSGGGGGGGCGGCSFNGSPVGGRAPGACDPCAVDFALTSVSCAVSFHPVLGPIWTVGSLAYSLSQQDYLAYVQGVNNAAIGDTLGQIDAMEGTNFGRAWNIAGCAQGFAGVYDRCGPGSGGRRSLLVNIDGDAQSASDAVTAEAERLGRLSEMGAFKYGGDGRFWGETEADNVKRLALDDAMRLARADTSPGGQFFTETEISGLAVGGFTYGEITTTDIEDMLIRLNTSAALYADGYLSKPAPGVSDSDWFSHDEYTSLQAEVLSDLTYYQSVGYELYWEAYEEALNAAEEIVNNPFKGVCATVTILIEQQALLTRTGFLASLELVNEQTVPLTNVTVDLFVLDDASEQAGEHFFISEPSINGPLSGVDGTTSSTLDPAGSALIQWIFVAYGSAAPTPDTERYRIGGTLSYWDEGIEVVVPLFPEVIFVSPDPRLYVKYFHERTVFSDDPFTPEIEPAIPYSLAMMVVNRGNGTALDFKVNSGQPEIIENEKGLYIDFVIISTRVNDEEAIPSLLADFGSLAPKSIETADWAMTSSLQGIFLSYNASFEYSDPLGAPALSLVDGVEVHELIHQVLVDYPPERSDGLRDMLVNDFVDAFDRPDTIHRTDAEETELVWYFEEDDNEVSTVVTENTATSFRFEIDLDSTRLAQVPTDAWFYLNVDDLATNGMVLRNVTATGTGRVIAGPNAWRTSRVIQLEDPIDEFKLHLVDNKRSGYEGPYEAYLTPLVGVDGVAVVEVGPTFVTLAWNASDNADIYRLEWKNSSSTFIADNQVLTTGTLYTVTGLQSNTSYRFEVFAGVGNSYVVAGAVVVVSTELCDLVPGDCDVDLELDVGSCQCLGCGLDPTLCDDGVFCTADYCNITSQACDTEPLDCGNGVCSEGDADCLCDSGWTQSGGIGSSCDTPVCSEACCSTGLCPGPGGVCQCDPGYGGVGCCVLLCPAGCVNGECLDFGDGPGCVCEDGWSGEDCSVIEGIGFDETEGEQVDGGEGLGAAPVVAGLGLLALVGVCAAVFFIGARKKEEAETKPKKAPAAAPKAAKRKSAGASTTDSETRGLMTAIASNVDNSVVQVERKTKSKSAASPSTKIGKKAPAKRRTTSTASKSPVKGRPKSQASSGKTGRSRSQSRNSTASKGATKGVKKSPGPRPRSKSPVKGRSPSKSSGGGASRPRSKSPVKGRSPSKSSGGTSRARSNTPVKGRSNSRVAMQAQREANKLRKENEMKPKRGPHTRGRSQSRNSTASKGAKGKGKDRSPGPRPRSKSPVKGRSPSKASGGASRARSNTPVKGRSNSRVATQAQREANKLRKENEMKPKRAPQARGRSQSRNSAASKGKGKSPARSPGRSKSPGARNVRFSGAKGAK